MVRALVRDRRKIGARNSSIAWNRVALPYEKGGVNAVARQRVEAELDELTVARAVRGDVAATRALVERYQVPVFALLSRMLPAHGRSTIEDVAQDTFLDVFRRLSTYRHDGPARLSTWILTIASRRAIDEQRRKRPAPAPDLETIAPARTDARAIQRELAAAVDAALLDLTPDQRAAFVLREYHDLDYDEIARVLEVDLGTVKSRLSRARAALRARLEGVGHE